MTRKKSPRTRGYFSSLLIALFDDFVISFLSRLSSRSVFFSSHSQTTTTFQSRFLRAAVLRLSRETLSSNFFVQNSVLVFGVVASEQPLCLCQKQPFTKTTVLYFANTMSGFPGRPTLWSLKRYPTLCRRLRTIISGFVSLLQTRLMFQLRFALDKLSVNQIISSIA